MPNTGRTTGDLIKQAEEVMAHKVYEPAFLAKCAELGVEFPDRETFENAMGTVVLLKEALRAQQSNTVKSAGDALRKMAGVPTSADEAKAQAETTKTANTVRTVAVDQEVLAAARQIAAQK